jgi:hypothetical protein
MSEKKLFEIDTIITFRHKYVIEAKCLEDAYDEITMRESGNDDDFFEEVTQRCLGETIVSGRKIKKKHFDALLIDLQHDDEETCSYWMGDDLIRTVTYYGEGK